MEEIKRVVIPVDTSDAAKIATEQGTFFAKLLNVGVSIISVNESKQYMISTILENKLKKEKESTLEEVKQLAEKQGVNVTTKLMLGSPAKEIMKFVKNDDLIVMASHGRKGFNKFLLGSVSEEVLHRAPCPVMIIKPNTEEKSTESHK